MRDGGYYPQTAWRFRKNGGAPPSGIAALILGLGDETNRTDPATGTLPTLRPAIGPNSLADSLSFYNGPTGGQQ